MKILLVNNFFAPEGGAELSTFLTYQLLQQQGHEVAFFATNRQPYFIPDYPYARYFPEYRDYDELDGTADKVKNLPRMFYNGDAEKQMDAMLTDFKPDVVHCNNIYYHLTPAILKACKRHRVPVLMTLRDVRLMCPAGTLKRGDGQYCAEELCVTGSAAHCIINKCYGNNLANSVVVTTEYYFRKLHGLYDTVTTFIAPSQAICDLAVRSGIAPERMTVINNFIDDNFFAQPAPTVPGDYFLFVGRLSREKGVLDLLDAMARLKPTAQGLPTLHIVGQGPEEQEIKRKTEELGLNNVVFRGFMTGPAIQEAYRNCLASLVPSNWFENFSRTVIESCAFGKPVIGSRIGGIQEVVEHEANGLLFTPGNVPELAACLQRIADNPAWAVELGQRARQKAEAHYNSRVYLEKTIAAYQQALMKSPRGALAAGR